MPCADVPPELPGIVERHGRVVAAGDQRAVLADFRPDRVGQLVAAADLPEDLVTSELLSLEPGPDGLWVAHIRYTSRRGRATVLRSRWISLEGGWRVNDVRNVPATPPRLGTEGPGEDALDAPHWAGLVQGELRIQRCRQCATWIWAPRPMCPACHATAFTWPAVDPRGTVYSWTRTWQPFAPGVRGHLPYVVVLVELPAAGGRRVLGALADGDTDPVAIGAAVTGEIDAPTDDSADRPVWPLLRWRLT